MSEFSEDIEYFRTDQWKHRELMEFLDDAKELETKLQASQARITIVEDKYRKLQTRSDNQSEGLQGEGERLKYNLEVSTGLNADLRLEVERLKAMEEIFDLCVKDLYSPSGKFKKRTAIKILHYLNK